MGHQEFKLSAGADSKMISGVVAGPHGVVSAQVAGKNYEYVLGTKDPAYIVPSSMVTEQCPQGAVRTLPATSISIAFG
jgi:hypothetical protein